MGARFKGTSKAIVETPIVDALPAIPTVACGGRRSVGAEGFVTNMALATRNGAGTAERDSTAPFGHNQASLFWVPGVDGVHIVNPGDPVRGRMALKYNGPIFHE